MGGDHGHGHHKPYTIPDYKIYKVENCPELLAVKNALARQGLKDPWLR
jgi:NADH dehydrogenase (ubiquinone) 1 beta subcomplex subunit 3